MAHRSFVDLPTEIKLEIFEQAPKDVLKALRLTNRATDKLVKPILFRFRCFFLGSGFKRRSSIIPYVRKAAVIYDLDSQKNTRQFLALVRAIPHGVLKALRINFNWDRGNVDRSCLEELFQSQPNLEHLELQAQCDWSESRIIPFELKKSKLRSLALDFGTGGTSIDMLDLDAHKPTLNASRQMLEWIPSLKELEIDAGLVRICDGPAIAEALFRNLTPSFKHTLTKLQLFELSFDDEDCNGIFDALDFSRLSTLSLRHCPGSSHFLKGLSLNYSAYAALAFQHLAIAFAPHWHSQFSKSSNHVATIDHLCSILSKAKDLRKLFVVLEGGTKLIPASYISELHELRELSLHSQCDISDGNPISVRDVFILLRQRNRSDTDESIAYGRYDPDELGVILGACSKLVGLYVNLDRILTTEARRTLWGSSPTKAYSTCILRDIRFDGQKGYKNNIVYCDANGKIFIRTSTLDGSGVRIVSTRPLELLHWGDWRPPKFPHEVNLPRLLYREG